MKIALLALLALVPTVCNAGLANCNEVYVGRIWLTPDAHGLNAVVFLESPTDSGGSYWVYFGPWTPEDKRSVLAVLTAAKIAGHRVNLETTNPDKCGIATGGTTAAAVYLSNSP